MRGRRSRLLAGSPVPAEPADAYIGDAMTYLDHAATTPMLPSALAAMTEQLARVGNASSLHASGRQARRVAEQSRERRPCRPRAAPTLGGP